MPTVALDLPRGKFMKTIVDRMAKLSKHVTIHAEQTGRMIFGVDHSTARIKTYYAGLTPRWDNLNQQVDHRNKAVVKLDIRRFSAVLNIHSMNWESSSIYIVDNQALILNVILSPHEAGTVTYYVPVIMSNDHFTYSVEQ